MCFFVAYQILIYCLNWVYSRFHRWRTVLLLDIKNSFLNNQRQSEAAAADLPPGRSYCTFMVLITSLSSSSTTIKSLVFSHLPVFFFFLLFSMSSCCSELKLQRNKDGMEVRGERFLGEM